MIPKIKMMIPLGLIQLPQHYHYLGWQPP